ncbi:cupin domain-containing protein [Nocardia iowensis]|uniref:Cupin domain-containing protein n=1 Tax=Nocardia iowensis TaxID=204891 RepID=A0ABX8RVC6_NOCIO|nr:cupin domain-containing protein [Nocardia iowensis]QXN93593.1 cupin domain-containing protein [Nocardia iowensis]
MQNFDIPALLAVLPGEGETVHIPGFGATYKLYGHQTNGAMSIVEHPFDVGTITPPHMHSREDEYSIVLAGRIGFRSDDTEVVLDPGGYIIKPRGEMHAMWNAGDVPGRIIEVIIPGGFETYFRDLADLIADTSTPAESFTELASDYGLTYGHPDWLDDVIERYHLNPLPQR